VAGANEMALDGQLGTQGSGGGALEGFRDEDLDLFDDILGIFFLGRLQLVQRDISSEASDGSARWDYIQI